MTPALTIVADRVFDGIRFRDELLRIDIQGNSISSIRVLNPEEGSSAPVLDARGATVLPGLINTHAHILRSARFGTREPISVAQIVRNLQSTLSAGVTTVGEMGSAWGMIHTLRRHVAAHADAGPSIIAAGPILTAPEAYPLDWAPSIYRKIGVVLTCATEKEACQTVRRLAEARMNHVKLAIMHRSYSDRPLAVIREPVARAVVAEAHALGLRVFAHAHSVADYQLALAAGVDALMHSSFEPLDAEMVTRVRDRGVYVCPTLWVFESVCLGAEDRWDRDLRYAQNVSHATQREWAQFCEAYAAAGEVLPPGIGEGLPKARAKEAVRIAAANLVLLQEAGVPVAFGDDSAYGFCLLTRPIDELTVMHRAGMSILECLQAATSGAAALLGCTDRGTLAPGKRADMIIVAGDVRHDLHTLEQVQAVIVAGKLVQHTLLKRARTALAVVRGLAITASWSIRDLLRHP